MSLLLTLLSGTYQFIGAPCLQSPVILTILFPSSISLTVLTNILLFSFFSTWKGRRSADGSVGDSKLGPNTADASEPEVVGSSPHATTHPVRSLGGPRKPQPSALELNGRRRDGGDSTNKSDVYCKICVV